MQIRTLAAPFGSAHGRRVIAVAVVIVGVLVWWWYPTLADESAGTDVAIIGDSFLQSAQHEITNRIHEDGFSLVWAVGGGPLDETEASAPPTTQPPGSDLTWCDAPAAVRDQIERHHPAIVVVSFASEGSCGLDPVAVRDAVATAVGSAKLIVVTNPATEDASPFPPGADVVRTSRLLGPDGTTDEGCQWFDTCAPNGRIDVRDASGALTLAGQTRVARMIVTELR